MTRIVLAMPGGEIWVPAAWTQWQLWGIDYRRTAGGALEYSTDGATWQPVPPRVKVLNSVDHPLTQLAEARRTSSS